MRVHSCEVNDAMLKLLESTPMIESADIRAMAVLRSGSRAGRMDPKTNSRMMRAATTPMIVLDEDDGLVDPAMAPTTSTCRFDEFGARARLTNLLASAAETVFASLENLTLAKAIRRLALIC